MEGTAYSQGPKACSQMGGELISIKTGFVVRREAEYKVLEIQPSSLVVGRIKKWVRERILRVWPIGCWRQKSLRVDRGARVASLVCKDFP